MVNKASENKVGDRIRRGLWRDRGAAVGAFMAFALVPLVGAIGFSIDAARGYIVKSRLSQALDAAGLAGGRAMFSPTRDADINMYFDANYPEGYLGAAVTGPSIQVDQAQENITLSAAATVPTTFMRVLGINYMNVTATATINRQNRGMELVLTLDNTGSMASNNKIGALRDAATELVNILYNGRETVPNFWIGIVPYAATVNIGAARVGWTTGAPPDVNVQSITRSGSTATVTTAAAHGYATDEIVTISNASQAQYNGRFVITRVSNTQFTYRVNGTPATPATPAAGQTIKAGKPHDYSQGGQWKGCVEARAAPLEEAQAESLPGGAPWRRFYWTSTLNVTFRNNGANVTGDNQWPPIVETVAAGNNATGPNLGCGPEIVPLQPSRAAALAAIAGMGAWSRGGTMANLGLAWAWRMLSPTWRGMWGGTTPATLPLDYGSPFMDKVVVLLTDGVNEWYDWPGNAPGCQGYSPCTMPSNADYTAYGRLAEGRLGSTNNSTATNNVNTRMTALCNAMKAQGITIYTIVLQVNNAATQALYQNCASRPEYYFLSPSADDLAQIFRTIGTQLSNLRVAR